MSWPHRGKPRLTSRCFRGCPPLLLDLYYRGAVHFLRGGSVEENEHAAGTVGNEDFLIRSCPFSGKVRSFGEFSFVRSSELQNFIHLLIPLLRTPNYD